MFFKILSIVTAIMIFITAVLTINCIYRKLTYQECKGIIVDFKNSGSNFDSSEGAAPVIEYTVGNNNYKFIGNFTSTSMRIGDKVSVLYRSDDESKAVMKSGLVFAPIVTGFISIMFLIVSIAFYCALKRKFLID